MKARLSFLVQASLLLFLYLGQVSLAQQNPISYQIETFVVENDGRLIPATSARDGQVVEYHIIATNTGDTTMPPNTVIITGPIPEGTVYVDNSATAPDSNYLIEYSIDGRTFAAPPIYTTSGGTRSLATPTDYKAVRWTLLKPFEPQAEFTIAYRVYIGSGQPGQPSQSPSNPPPATRSCCRYCRTGKACGDSCINRSYTCYQGAGCACNASVDTPDYLIADEERFFSFASVTQSDFTYDWFNNVVGTPCEPGMLATLTAQ